MAGWALCLRRAEAKFLAKLHGVDDVKVGESDNPRLVWAWGAGTDAELDRVLTLVPTARIYHLLERDRLRSPGKLLPTATLPNLAWVPLRKWLSVRIPSAALPGRLSSSAKLELIRDPSRRVHSDDEQMLLCGVEVFREFLLRAPAHRLARLRFVLNQSCAEVLVRGQPLPSLPGDRYVLNDGVVTPAGYAWSPPIGACVIRSWLGVRDDAIALWKADGGLSEIEEEAFVGASRSAGREL